jgi:hypothetical protein
LCKLIGWLICHEVLVPGGSERVWQQEYVTLIDGEDLPQLFITFHLHNAVREALDCIEKRVLIYLHVIHDYINLRFLINLFPDLHYTVSGKLDSIFHILIHLALITD